MLLSDTPLPSKPVKPHDWTYSTCYAGCTAGPSVRAISPTIICFLLHTECLARQSADLQSFKPSTMHEIPMKLLARQDPALDQILYYDDVGLFEDELHDNGDCTLNVRIVSLPCTTVFDAKLIPARHAAFLFHPLQIVLACRQRLVQGSRRTDIPRIWQWGGYT